MKEKVFTPSNIALIAANVVPLIGVLFLGWDGKGIFVLYIVETIIIGLINVLKMLTVYFVNGTRNETPQKTGNGITGLAIIPFFIFHYNFFIFVQSVLFFAFSSIWQPHGGPEPFDLVAQFSPYITGETQPAMIALLIANLVYLLDNFILHGDLKKQSISGLMFQPYKRIFVQQFVVILGGFIFMLSGSVTAVAVLFILLKIAADYISANYSNNPKVKQWILQKSQQNGKELTNEEKAQIESIFGKNR